MAVTRAANPPSTERMEALRQMGFAEHQAQKALAECGGDAEAAINYIMAHSQESEEFWRRPTTTPLAAPAQAAPAAGFLAPETVEHTAEHLGRGGSGIVHKGWLMLPDSTRSEVAIKMLAPGATEREVQQFQKEYIVHWNASQRCPGACVMHGCVHRGTDLCLVMKLYRGGSLHEKLDARRDPRDDTRREPLPLRDAVGHAMQLAEALAQLHAERIVCSDLKPGNVLIDEDGSLVISDFGLAVMLERTVMRTSTRTGDGAGGTAAYMAPEQHDSDTFGRVSPKTDVWALGCIILEMVTGLVPWVGAKNDPFLLHSDAKNDLFTKTGSGQTLGKLR